MEKDRKIHNQGTGKEENRVENIMPDPQGNAGADDLAAAGVAPEMQEDDMNTGNEVTADIPVGEANNSQGKTDALHNNNTTNDYLNEVDVNIGDVPLDKSPGATNQENNPSNASLTQADLDAAPSREEVVENSREAVARSVDEDAEKQTGRPTGAIYGSGGDIMAVKGFESADSATEGEKQ